MVFNRRVNLGVPAFSKGRQRGGTPMKRALAIMAPALGGAFAGAFAVVLFVAACTAVAGPSDPGLWLAGFGVVVGAISGSTVAVAIFSKGDRSPPQLP
jgi:hypothetical protein